MELENTAKQKLEELQKQVQEEAEKRKKQIMKREVPARRTLKNALAVAENAGRDDLSAALREMLARFEKSQAETRNANRVRAAKRRGSGCSGKGR